MRTIGLFEAKAKLSEICDTIATGGKGVLITKRGKPFVRIEPLEKVESESSVWAARRAFIKANGKISEDLKLPKRTVRGQRDYLDDDASR